MQILKSESGMYLAGRDETNSVCAEDGEDKDHRNEHWGMGAERCLRHSSRSETAQGQSITVLIFERYYNIDPRSEDVPRARRHRSIAAAR